MSKERSCTSKVRYGHAETAYRAIEAMRAKKGEVLESYECEYCRGWHIGHRKTGFGAVQIPVGASEAEIVGLLKAKGITDGLVIDAILSTVRNVL